MGTPPKWTVLSPMLCQHTTLCDTKSSHISEFHHERHTLRWSHKHWTCLRDVDQCFVVNLDGVKHWAEAPTSMRWVSDHACGDSRRTQVHYITHIPANTHSHGSIILSPLTICVTLSLKLLEDRHSWRRVLYLFRQDTVLGEVYTTRLRVHDWQSSQ